MMKFGALQQGPLCVIHQHRTTLSSRLSKWPISQGPLQHASYAGHLRLRGVFHQSKDTRALAQAQPTQASKVLPVRTKTALRKMPKAELEEEMMQLSLDTKGTKQELVDRLHAYLAAQEAEGSPEDAPIADHSPNIPEGWPFEAEAEDADLPPDIKALLKLQAEGAQMGDVQDGASEQLEPESSMIFGASESAEDLQALPKKELQEKLAQRGLPKSGNKAELAQRLHAALAEEQDMLLQDQMEARDELQRQFQESIINPTGRMEAEEQEDPRDRDPAGGIPEDSYDQWAMDIEAEFQSPDDDAELSLEDAEAAGATPGAVRDEEGGVLLGRFNRPHAMMDLFEYQGTKAAELAGEDYAAQRRGGAEHSQALAGDSSLSQQRMATPVDSQDEGDLFGISMTGGNAEDDEDDGYENDIENDLEDGFSMAAEDDGDGFDPDMEEEIVREAEDRSMPSSLQASTSEYIGHRNYEALSSRSPDDIEEDLGLLDTIISAASSESFPQAKLDLDGPSSSHTPSTSATMDSPLNLSRRVPKPQSVKPGQAPAVVASQGTSSLDFGTAKDWMSTRLPEALRLGITPDQLISEAAPLQSQAASADAVPNSSSAFSRGSSEVSDRSSRDRSGQVEDESPASSKPEAPEEQQQAESLLEEEVADTEVAAADTAAYDLDSDLLDELAEDALGKPGASPEDAAAAQLTSTVSAIQQELEGAEALTSGAPDGRCESVEADGLSVLDASASPSAELGVQAEAEVGKIPANAPDSASTAEEAASQPEAALPLPDASEVLAAEGPGTVSEQGDQEMTETSAGPTADEEDRDADQLPAQHLSEELIDTVTDAAPGNSEGTTAEEQRDETDVQSLSADTETETRSAAASQMLDTVSPSEQLELEDSKAMAPGSISASPSAPSDVPAEPQDTESADDGLTDNHQQYLVGPEPADDRSANLLNGTAETPSGEPLKEERVNLAKDQQELAALRVEMAQKQGALAALQSQVAAVGRSNKGNTAQIAQLQVAMASLQSQRLDLQRANLSGRLAVLQDIAAQASLNAAAKEDLQEQLQTMRDELTQLEVDLSSRDTEAADLSRKLAHARTKLGDPTAVPPANGHARGSLPGEMRARLGKSDELMVGRQHTVEQDHDHPRQSAEGTPDSEQSGMESVKKSTTQPGVVVAAGLLGAFKAFGGIFKRTKRDEQS